MASQKNAKGRLRCFVAMAFDHEDTDRVYGRIAAALLSMGITPIRVDRIEHNDDIDKRIITEIESADFVLADLTYARPSVYFEAGYAQRSAPVIYTARRDHFRAKDNDPDGNFRVHFDLQMKNIIAWTNETDAQFIMRLKARINKVIVPIVKGLNADTELKRQADAFNRRSLHDRQQSILNVGTLHFQQLGYRIVELKFKDRNMPDYVSPGAGRAFPGAIVATKFQKDIFTLSSWMPFLP
jgi:nucleoside 2-deoxyribosyltransferase